MSLRGLPFLKIVSLSGHLILLAMINLDCSGFRRVCFSPWVTEERAEAEVVAVALDFDFGHVEAAGHAFEGGNGVGTHDLRRDEEMNAVDHAAGKKAVLRRVPVSVSRVRMPSSPSLSSNFVERNAAGIRRENFDADAAGLKIADAGFVIGDGEDDDVVLTP